MSLADKPLMSGFNCPITSISAFNSNCSVTPGCLLWIRVYVRWKRALKWSLTLSLESKQTGNTVVQLSKHKFCSDYNKTKLLSVQTGGWQEGSVDKKSEHPTKPDSLILNPRTYHHYVERTYSKLSSDLHTYYPMHIK